MLGSRGINDDIFGRSYLLLPPELGE
ncbi:hypothetical protein A2U01_0081293, partial [Trifolium medium]|nr:hypothetical protein [Trifolium medium]